MGSGVFVTIDGPNGVGKTTLAELVRDFLQTQGLSCHLTGEPSDGPVGHFIRRNAEDLRGDTLACLVAADRYDHLDREIAVRLAAVDVVISARYVESSLVLQRLDGLPLQRIWALNSQVLVPDLSVLLTASAPTLRNRLGQRNTLARHERDYSPDQELAMYQEAVSFLQPFGFRHLCLSNETTSPTSVAKTIGERIILLTRTSGPT